ncbi:glycosyltransferase family 4 protein [Granulicella arctica]|uniref:Glycosyltransferase involved in cell wall biosynthesis n=1 Tax=Granulicella arctica TaxID=940613 RepID=A0A7Y9PKD3_9BACT|nr:glycosyltransferase family 4 protein [Granulicella arctica]NYF80688.1 glycosyltransferase involved in cell wall biosynthesis [Granulicella arctica]
MNVTQAVFGVFHHFELAHQLHKRNHLQKIYSTWPWARLKREGLPRSLVGCFPLIHTTDYLLGRTRFYPAAVSAVMNSWNARGFDWWTRSVIQPCDAFIAISGAGLLTGAKVQANGGKFICDRGSTHQRYQENLLAEEYRRWNAPQPLSKPHIAVREEAIYARADAITVPSSVAKRSFIQMGIPAEKVHVIPYGVRLDQFARTVEPPTDSFEVLFAGQVSLRKGIPYLLEAFSRLKHPKKRLTVVGSVQDDVRGLLGKLPQEHVTFTGSIPQAELAKKMSASHLLMLTSVEEGLALVQGQAMACGCPVLATTATGAEDLFTDGVEGFIVADRDVDALAARLQEIADDPALQSRLSEAALLRVKSLGGWDRYGEIWDRLLHGLTGLPHKAER